VTLKKNKVHTARRVPSHKLMVLSQCGSGDSDAHSIVLYILYKHIDSTGHVNANQLTQPNRPNHRCLGWLYIKRYSPPPRGI
jgi:hypothetical protein